MKMNHRKLTNLIIWTTALSNSMKLWAMPCRAPKDRWFMVKVKAENEKPGLKLNIQKTKIMASSPITSWQIDGEKVEIVSDFIFLGSKSTVDGNCSHKTKRHLLP